MLDLDIKPHNAIWDAIRTGNRDLTESLFKQFPEMKNYRLPGFGTWLHYAAGHSTLAIVRYLIEELGIDVNSRDPNGKYGHAIDDAAAKNKPDIARYLIDRGAELRTEESDINPLFSASIGDSPEIIQMLVDAGIDTTTKYSGEKWHEMDAVAFCLLYGHYESANMIALKNANGNMVVAKAALNRADIIANYAAGVIKELPREFRSSEIPGTQY